MTSIVPATPAPAPLDEIDWVTAFFRTADSCNADNIGEWFADDIELRFANNLPTFTKVEAREGLRQFMSSVKAMSHRRDNLIIDGNSASQQAIVIYTTHDDRDVPIPVASYLRRNDEKRLDRLWIYIDIGPLFAAA